MYGVIISDDFLSITVHRSGFYAKALVSTIHNPIMSMHACEAERILADLRQREMRYQEPYNIYYLDMVVRTVEMMIYDMHDIHARSHAEEITGLVQTTRTSVSSLAICSQA